MSEWTHFDQQGNVVMVDVSSKQVTQRKAIATGKIHVNDEVLEKIQAGAVKKGDVFTIAQIAGIMGCKKTANLIPLCHPLSLTHTLVTFTIDQEQNDIITFVEVTTDGKTGVEMEALTGVSVALLTIYDMCKAIDRGMCIHDIHLVEKSGGRSGLYQYQKTDP